MKKLIPFSLIAFISGAIFTWAVINNPSVAVGKTLILNKIGKDCTFKGFKMYGKFKIVEHFPDVKVKIVNSFPDLKVKYVNNFPNNCGEWQLVENFPDVKIQFVESFPDITIQIVEHFPGLP